jgi:hypothetical protein
LRFLVWFHQFSRGSCCLEIDGLLTRSRSAPQHVQCDGQILLAYGRIDSVKKSRGLVATMAFSTVIAVAQLALETRS